MDGHWFFGGNWHEVFALSVPVLELFVRATLLYFGFFILLRAILRRQIGSLGTTDLLLVVLIASSAHNGMGAANKSISDALLMASIMVMWNVLLQYISQHSPWVARLLHPPAICLVKNGRYNRKAMNHELITEDEILTQMRQQGIDDVKRIKLACLEGDGKISILTHDKQRHRKPRAAKA